MLYNANYLTIFVPSNGGTIGKIAQMLKEIKRLE